MGQEPADNYRWWGGATGGAEKQLPVLRLNAGAGLERPASITVFPHQGRGKTRDAERSCRELGSRVRNALRGRTLEA